MVLPPLLPPSPLPHSFSPCPVYLVSIYHSLGLCIIYLLGLFLSPQECKPCKAGIRLLTSDFFVCVCEDKA